MGFGNPMGGNYAIHQVIFSRQPLRTMQDLTRLRQRRNSFITVVLIIALIVIIRAGATVVNQGDTPTRFAKQFTGRDVYSPDVHPNPVGSGYIMWYLSLIHISEPRD